MRWESQLVFFFGKRYLNVKTNVILEVTRIHTNIADDGDIEITDIKYQGTFYCM